jgi:hypothetical protein
MTTNKTNNIPPLDEVLYTFAAETRDLDADLLDEYVRSYPDYADALTTFAISLALDALERPDAADTKSSASEMTTVTPAVSRAISKFQNRLYELRKSSAAASKATGNAEKARAANPFGALDRTTFRAIAQELNASTVFVAKLRDRQIEPATMTPGFLKKLSDTLHTSVDLLMAYLNANPSVQISPQFFKAKEKPHVATRQSFQDAVRSSALDDEQQRYLLSL